MKTLTPEFAAFELVDYLREIGLECSVSLSSSTGSSYVSIDTYNEDMDVIGMYEIRLSDHARKYNFDGRECLDLNRDDVDYGSLVDFVNVMLDDNFDTKGKVIA